MKIGTRTICAKKLKRVKKMRAFAIIIAGLLFLFTGACGNNAEADVQSEVDFVYEYLDMMDESRFVLEDFMNVLFIDLLETSSEAHEAAEDVLKRSESLLANWEATTPPSRFEESYSLHEEAVKGQHEIIADITEYLRESKTFDNEQIFFRVQNRVAIPYDEAMELYDEEIYQFLSDNEGELRDMLEELS
ncbi:hypothetical protein [Alkalicoccus luteus]|uniref:hypothetical protein n=1 Tax=Alkalicoccus luteus TaxID=1237094 RepID=UPI004033252E